MKIKKCGSLRQSDDNRRDRGELTGELKTEKFDVMQYPCSG